MGGKRASDKQTNKQGREDSQRRRCTTSFTHMALLVLGREVLLNVPLNLRSQTNLKTIDYVVSLVETQFAIF